MCDRTERNVLTAVRELSADATQSIMRRTAGLKDSAPITFPKAVKSPRSAEIGQTASQTKP